SISKNSNRMGYCLSGEALQRELFDEMISSGVTFGTIQLLPDGQLIVLMADHQTTGGYPRIANVVAADLPLLAQIGPGDGVSFHMISPTDAEEVYLDLERDFRLLKVGCRFDYSA
ncbi:MAG TPA: KipI antagonist, partial [Pyrinomonadaceae bacterium]|nr:KipI antagonist [Pyrinomonadaceae bacterium]